MKITNIGLIIAAMWLGNNAEVIPSAFVATVAYFGYVGYQKFRSDK